MFCVIAPCFIPNVICLFLYKFYKPKSTNCLCTQPEFGSSDRLDEEVDPDPVRCVLTVLLVVFKGLTIAKFQLEERSCAAVSTDFL